MKTKRLLVVPFLFFSFIIFAQTAEEQQVIDDAQKAKKEFLANAADIQAYFDDAKAYVIFPNVGKGALIVGAASGNGAVYERGVLVGMADLKQLDIGAQIGGKVYSEVVFFKTDKALQDFMNDDFQFAGNVAAIAINKSAPSINLKYDNGVAVFTLPKEGLMAEVSVGGQRFEYEAFD